MTIRPSAWLAIVFCFCGAFGCSVRRPKVPEPVVRQPLPPPEAPPASATAGVKSPESLPPPPELAPAPAGAAVPPLISGESVPPPPPVPREKSSGAGRPPAAGPPSAAAGGDGSQAASAPSEVSNTQAGAAAVPRLTTVLSEKERWEHNQEIDRNLVYINDLLGELDPGRLSAEQHTALDRIRAIIRQTVETRTSDLPAALNLARRAALLSEDLRRTSR